MEFHTVIHTYHTNGCNIFIVPTKILKSSDYKEFTDDSDSLSFELSKKIKPYEKYIKNDGINSYKIDAVYFLEKSLQPPAYNLVVARLKGYSDGDLNYACEEAESICEPRNNFRVCWFPHVKSEIDNYINDIDMMYGDKIASQVAKELEDKNYYATLIYKKDRNIYLKNYSLQTE